MKHFWLIILAAIPMCSTLACTDQVTLMGTVVGPDDEAIEGASIAVEYWEGHRITAGRRATPSL